MVASAWAERLATDAIATCAQIRLEILCSARSAKDYARLATELPALHQLTHAGLPPGVATSSRDLLQSRDTRVVGFAEAVEAPRAVAEGEGAK